MDAQSLFRRVSNIHLVLYSPLQRGGAMAPCEVLNACLKIHAENDVGWILRLGARPNLRKGLRSNSESC
jgi:hypothetical protein